MQKISRTDYEALRLRSQGKKHPVRRTIEAMEVGELLKISLLELRWKRRTPSFFTNQISKTTEKRFIVSTVYNNGGWVVERLE